MEIKRIAIQSYGPLSRLDIDLTSGLNVIFGPNGSGKTLMIEALQKLLLGRKKGKKLESTQVEDYPLGEIIIRVDNADQAFNGSKQIENIGNITSEDLDSIFLIKDGCLEVEDGKDFYENIVPRLIGLNISDIDKVLDELLELGRLTEKLKLSDSKNQYKPKTQLKRAETLLEGIRNFLDEKESDEFLELDYNLSKLKATKERVKKQLELLKKAKLAEQLKKQENHLKSAEILDEQLKNLHIPELREIEEKINLYRNLPMNIEDYQVDKNTWRRYGMISFIITIMSTLTVMIIPSFFILILLSFLGFLVVLYCLNQELSVNKKVTEVRHLERELKAVVAAGSLPIDSIDGLKAFIEENNKSIAETRNGLLGLNAIIGDACPEAKENNGIVNYGIFRKYLEEQSRKVTIDTAVQYDEIKEQQKKDELTSIEDEIEKYREMREEFTGKLREFENDTNKIDFQAFLDRDIDIVIKNIESLEIVTEYIKELIETINTDMIISKEAHAILERVHEQETAKIAEYFNEETNITALMERISDGLFKKVEYNPEEGEFYLTREGDLLQSIDQLSRGELSQLYFVVRLSLGARLLEEKGFLVMEDPFLPSDDERLENQMKILTNFVDEGWQVIFSTSRIDMKEKLEINGGKLVKQLNRL